MSSVCGLAIKYFTAAKSQLCFSGVMVWYGLGFAHRVSACSNKINEFFNKINIFL